MFFVLLFALFYFMITSLIPTAHALPNPLSAAAHTLERRGSGAQIDAFLLAHNIVREDHNATALTWSPAYAAKAEEWADACNFARTGGILSTVPYGELHTAATGAFDISTAIGQFVKDKADYTSVVPTYNHFTQIVWKSTTQVGCARATCNNLFGSTGTATYYVCFYNPAGNVIGQAPENVQI